MKQTRLGYRIGALLLAMVMVFSILPMTAFAADDDPTETIEATEVVETEPADTEPADTEPVDTEPADTEPVDTEPADTEPADTEPADTEPADTEPVDTEPVVTEPEEPVVETTEETVPETTEETMDIMTLDLEVDLLAIYYGQKPADGITNGQPFPQGTGESKNFRIPAMVTLDDGTIVAATDARWNNTVDAGGLDTIVSYSTDKGATWHYTFANYLGDNDNEFNKSSTCFIDPALATDGNTVYMLVDLFPAGYALNGADNQPVAGKTGFDDNGHLLLMKKGESNYNYYVSGNSICRTSNNTDTGAWISDKFEVGGKSVFCADCEYQVYPTNYLYLTKSTDGGKSWSAPTLINAKKASEQTYLVGPGRGLVTKDGTIIFPCYEYTTGTQNASFIYSKDDGKTWTRSTGEISETTRYGQNNSVYSSWSSEAAVVELDNSNIRMFFRNGWGKIHYADAVKTNDGYTFGEFAQGPDVESNCQLSAIKYSQKIDGKDAFIISCPSGSGRANGKIFVALDNGNGYMDWKYEMAVNSGFYAYSCLTELADGRIALLAEDGNGYGSETFRTYTLTDIVGEEVDPNPNPDPKPEPPVVEEETEEVYLLVGGTKTFNNKTGDYSGSWSDAGLNKGIATVAVQAGPTIPGGFVKGDKVNSITSGNQYILVNQRPGTMLTNEADGKFLKLDSVGAQVTAKDVWTITGSNGKYQITDAAGKYLNSTNGGASAASYMQLDLAYESGYWTIGSNHYYLNQYGGEYATVVGGYYYIDGGSYWDIYSVTSTAETPTTNVTIRGVGVGTTSVQVGNVTYNIHVVDVPSSGTTVTTGNSPVVAGEGQGTGKIVTKVNLTENVNFDLKLAPKYTGQSAIWVSKDPDVATVDQNGTVHGVAPGETEILVQVGGETYAIPVVVHEDGSGHDIDTAGDQHIDIYISKIDNTRVYYSLTGILSGTTMNTDLVETYEGEIFYLNYPNTYKIAFDFFGSPYDGYALTRMSATNAAGDYMALQNKNDPTQCDFYTKMDAAGGYQRGHFSDAAVQNVLTAAMDSNHKCDGGLGFTRGPNDKAHINSDLTFRSEKLPTVEKEVYGILPEGGSKEDFQEYKPGMTASVGDTVYFKVTVTKEAYQDVVDFADMKLTEQLTGAQFVEGQGVGKPIGPTVTLDNTAIGSATKTDWDKQPGYTDVRYVAYKIQAKDLDSTIVNTVKLDYTYKSKYSSGTFGGTANAEAAITATKMQPKSVVIDFGLPVAVTFTQDDLESGYYSLVDGDYTGTYGTAKVAGNTVTYTPNKVLLGADNMTIKVTSNKMKGEFDLPFTVHPASNVLYEAEDFMAIADEPAVAPWGRIDNALGNQSSANEAPYGFDIAYVGKTGTLGGYSIDIDNGKTPALTTSFYGDTFDLIGTCGPDTGTVLLKIVDSNNVIKKAIVVDTSYHDTNRPGDIHQVPWAHAQMGNVDRFTAEVIGYYRNVVTGSASTFGAAGAGIDDTLYAIMDDLDAEGFDLNKVEFVYFDEASALAQMNNASMMTMALDGARSTTDVVDNPTPGGRVWVDSFRVYMNSDAKNSSYTAYDDTEKDVTYTNILDAVINETAAYIEGGNENPAHKADYQDKGGPQNEVYLAKDQSVSFKVNGGSVVQVSVRAVNGGTTWKVNNGAGMSITSNTEMYYNVQVSNGLVTITNTTDNLLALGNIKSKGAVARMTAADIEAACVMLSAPVKPEEPEAPETFTPDLKAKAQSKKLKDDKDKSEVTVTVTTSDDVVSITVNGQYVDTFANQGSKKRVFIFTETVGSKDKPSYEIIGYNADGAVSAPISVKG